MLHNNICKQSLLYAVVYMKHTLNSLYTNGSPYYVTSSNYLHAAITEHYVVASTLLAAVNSL